MSKHICWFLLWYYVVISVFPKYKQNGFKSVLSSEGKVPVFGTHPPSAFDPGGSVSCRHSDAQELFSGLTPKPTL